MSKLLTKDLLTWIELQNARLQAADSKTKGTKAALRERIFWQMAKLSEEVGELADAILAKYGLQRAEKLDATADEQLGSELADVLIVTLLLSNRLEVDIDAALKKKIAKIDKRFAHIHIKQN